MNTLQTGTIFAGYRLLEEKGRGDRTWRRAFIAERIGDTTMETPEKDRPKAALITYSLDGLPERMQMAAEDCCAYNLDTGDISNMPRVREIGYYLGLNALHIHPVSGFGEWLHEGQMYAWIALERFDGMFDEQKTDLSYAKALGRLQMMKLPADADGATCTDILSTALRVIASADRTQADRTNEVLFALRAAGFERDTISDSEDSGSCGAGNGSDDEDEDDSSEDESDSPDRSFDFDPFAADTGREHTCARIAKAEGRGFGDVAGMAELKSRLRRDFVSILKHQELARAYGITPPNGLLLYGAPGCGKTFIARKVAEESGLNFSLVKPSDLGSTFIHGTQTMIADLFRQAETQAPTVLCLDEVDAMIPRRSGDERQTNSAGEVNEFLTQMNNCAERGIYVIGMTNRPDRIDPAMLRKGRFDELVYIPMPDRAARREMFALELERRPTAGTDLDRLAALTERYTAGDIAYIVREAAREKFERCLADSLTEPDPLNQQTLERVIARTHPSVSPDDLREYEKMHARLSQRNDKAQRRCIGY